MKFQSNVAGQVTALRFFRSTGDTATDILDLWSATGTKLASATFTNTAASGWQTVTLPTPVSITANTTYVASYHTTGAYVATNNFFTSAVTSGPLTAPATTTITGGNGVYAYGGTGTTGIFPTNTFDAANYWADVVFVAAGSNNAAPTAAADTGDATEKGGVANGSGGSLATGNVLTNDTDPDAGDSKTVTAVSFGATAGTLGTALNGAHGSLVLNAAGAFTYTINENDAAVQALLSTNTLTDIFSYTMRDTAGATSTASLTVTIHGANDTPVLAIQTANQTASVGSLFSLPLQAGTFTDVDGGDTLTYTATAADGSALPAWLTFTSATRSFSGTPTTTGTLGVKVTATDSGGLATSETFNIIVTPTPNTAPTAVADTGDATEKGGVANGLGGSLATGNVLTNDTDPDAGDTKTVTAFNFGATVGTLGTTPLAGAHGSLVLNAAGAFTYTINENDAAVQALRLPTNTLTDIFSYTMRDTAGATSTASLTVTIHGANDAPVLAAQTANQTANVGSLFSLPLQAGTFTDVDGGDTLTYTATAADGSALPAWLTFTPATRSFSGTPTTTGTLGVKVTATDSGGLATSETFNIVTSAAPPPTFSLFNSSNTPTLAALNDGRQLEVGVKFQSNTAGDITALKFYRSASDTGTDILDLWSSTGTKLASATFTNTAASGWQTVTLPTPVSITANTTYVASYHTTGAYVATSNFFTSAVTSGPLTAPATSAITGGNGVYSYGGTSTAGIFPTSTFGAANYYADVVFRPQLAG